MTNDLVSAAQAGSDEAKRRLVEESWDWSYRLAQRILRGADGAQDVAQDACLAVLRSLPKIRDANAFRAWLARTTLRLCLRRRAADTTVDIAIDSDSAIDVSSWKTSDLDRSLDLGAAVDSLSETLRVPVLLFYGLDLTTAEVANALDIPEGTVRWRLAEARRKLRAALEPHADIRREATP